MLPPTFLSFALLTSALALPVQDVALSLDRRQSQPFNSSLPTIAILATGGTIAGSAASAGAATGYAAGSLGIDILLNAVPEIYNFTNVEGIQFSNVGSPSLNTTIGLQLSRNITNLLSRDDMTGAVVTHGTDTLEETAFLLDLTVASKKAVVVVGAMRPATAYSADGPFNLLEACSTASTPIADGRGTMIVLNDRISSAYYTYKTNANRLDTFKAPEQGYLGTFVNSAPKFYYEPALPTHKQFFDVSNIESLPRVDILYAYFDMNVDILVNSWKNGAAGIVIAGEGSSGTDPSWNPVIRQIVAAGIPIIRGSRTGNNYNGPQNGPSGISAGVFNVQKSKILLQLCLATFGADFDKIAETFYVDYELPTVGPIM